MGTQTTVRKWMIIPTTKNCSLGTQSVEHDFRVNSNSKLLLDTYDPKLYNTSFLDYFSSKDLFRHLHLTQMQARAFLEKCMKVFGRFFWSVVTASSATCCIRICIQIITFTPSFSITQVLQTISTEKLFWSLWKKFNLEKNFDNILWNNDPIKK